MNSIELLQQLTALADELREVNSRLFHSNKAIFGHASDIPQEPPSEAPASNASIAPKFPGFLLSVDLQLERIRYYVNYSRAMLLELEQFTTDGKLEANKPLQQNDFRYENQMQDRRAIRGTVQDGRSAQGLTND